MKKPATIKRVQGLSSMVATPEFDIIKGYAIDYMHCVCLGVVKKIISIWLDNKNCQQPYYLTEAKVNAIDYMSKIKPCSFFTRRPRSLKEFSPFKASEARALLLYYFFPTFSFLGSIPSEYITHMQILSSSIYNLLGMQITNEVLAEAERNLNYFVSKYEEWYSKVNVVMNLHLLTHLPWTVHNWGLLWCQSAFVFESMNGVVGKYVVGPVKPVQKMLSKYTISKFLNHPTEKNVNNIKTGMIPSYSFESEEKRLLQS